MRTYEILDADGTALCTQEVDDSIAPVLVAGQSARLVEVDGERLARASRVAVGPDAPPAPDVHDLETEASRESRSDSADAAGKRAAAAKSRSDLRAKAARAAAAKSRSDLRAKAEAGDAASDPPAPRKSPDGDFADPAAPDA